VQAQQAGDVARITDEATADAPLTAAANRCIGTKGKGIVACH
jgi:hypothetical protein